MYGAKYIVLLIDLVRLLVDLIEEKNVQYKIFCKD